MVRDYDSARLHTPLRASPVLSSCRGAAGTAGLTIESEYHLERDEGSDFFKSISHKTNGRDATGLGLKAWMIHITSGKYRRRSRRDLNPEPVFAGDPERHLGGSRYLSQSLHLLS